ncbi:hypothetical protein SAURM35S_02500 [Streptomyces aurantiogriseus]
MTTGPAVTTRSTDTFSRASSQRASSSALGFSASLSTAAETIGTRAWSRAAASIERHGVSRVQARSVSPGAYDVTRASSARSGCSTAYMSVIRRWASAPSGSLDGFSGASTGHHTTTGASGSSSGRTTESAWSETSPYVRRTTVSPVPASAPTRTSASRWELVRSRGVRACRLMTTRVREGCSCEASSAALIAS